MENISLFFTQYLYLFIRLDCSHFLHDYTGAFLWCFCLGNIKLYILPVCIMFLTSRTEAFHELEMVQLEVVDEAVLFKQVHPEVEEGPSVGEVVQGESVEIPVGHVLEQARSGPLIRLVHQHPIFRLHELEARPPALVIFMQTEKSSWDHSAAWNKNRKIS